MDFEEKDLKVFSYEGTNYKTLLTEKFRQHKPYAPEDPNMILAQIPGTILKIMVREGQYVNPSKVLFILEAMKMKNKVYASIPGKVKKIHIAEGQTVTKNQLLLELGEQPSLFSKLLKKSTPKEPRVKEPKVKKRGK